MVRRSTALASVMTLLLACEPRRVECTPQASPANKADRIEPFRGMVYTAQLAARFSLPAEGVRSLDPGLQAIVIRVVHRPGDHPDCFLDLYLDDDLEVSFPDGSEGVMARPDDVNPFFFVAGEENLRAEDRRWNSMVASFHSVACRNGSDHCKVDEEIGPYAYARHLFPGVALQTYRPLCSAFDPANGPTELWILRNGYDRQALDATAKSTEGTYRFRMPAELFELAAPSVLRAIQHYAEHPQGPAPPRGKFRVPGL